uniref:UBP34/UBP24/USP9X/USP9Y-like ARM repeat region domain-containing protein n=1 Tax=Amphimedon queenslandica TaxID=400682 RepID=A0A1X7TIR8_AMPQE
RDKEFEECQRFYREGLTTSFIRILTDDAVKTWKLDIQLDIYNNSRYLVELCVYKIEDDSTYLLDLLAIVFNPSCKWNVFNSSEDPTSCVPGEKWEELLYARPLPDAHKHNMKVVCLVVLINRFGQLGRFDFLKKRICKGELTVHILSFLLRPFGLCSSFLTKRVRNDYIIAIVDKSIEFINSLNDDLLKKEATTDSRSETFSSIMKSLHHLCSVIPGRDDIEMFCLKIIFRLLQIPSFSGKINALNEINKIVPSMSYHPHFRTIGDEEQLTTERIAMS